MNFIRCLVAANLKKMKYVKLFGAIGFVRRAFSPRGDGEFLMRKVLVVKKLKVFN